MNIKGLVGLNPSQQLKPVDKVDRAVKSDITHDRDSNGRQEYSQTKDDQNQRPLTPEELEKSISHLRNLGVVKEHKWTIELLEENGKKFVLVKDNLGTIIRRIPELELWTLTFSDESTSPSKGQLLRKSA